MAKAKKLPSGAWRCLAYSHTDADGKRKYKSFTASTKKEAEYMAAAFASGRKVKEDKTELTFLEAANKYLESKENVLSPSTIRGYRAIIRNYTIDLNGVNIFDIDNALLQRVINKQAAGRSAKTVSNIYGFCTAVLSMWCPDFKAHATLPQKIKKEIVVPTDEEIQTIMKLTRENFDLYFPVCLAAFGSLRRSEICALSIPQDLTNKGVIVRKSKVLSNDGYVIKSTTKTASSQREAILPPFLVEQLRGRKGSVTKYVPNALSDTFAKLLAKNGMRAIRFHDLRHYWASCAFAEGMTDHYIMVNGGWSTMTTPRAVYAHIMRDRNDDFMNSLNARFSKMQHEMQHNG